MNSENSGMFKINLADVAKSAINAAIVAILIAIGGVMGNGFDVFTADWQAILNVIINAGLGAFVGDIVRRFTTDKQGKFLGIAKVENLSK